MSAIVLVPLGLLLVAMLVVVVVGPERLWSGIGPADLGPVEFETLTRRNSPNDALACPPFLCKVESDLDPPVFATDVEGLRAALAQVIASEPRVTHLQTDDGTSTERYVQRSALFGFPDTIVIRYLEQAGATSTLAIYSRSQLGYSDMGVNRARIQRWFDKLKNIVPVVR